jgi:hypothetical protein
MSWHAAIGYPPEALLAEERMGADSEGRCTLFACAYGIAAGVSVIRVGLVLMGFRFRFRRVHAC